MPIIDQQEIGAAVDHLVAHYPATATLDRYVLNGFLPVAAAWVNGDRFCGPAEDAAGAAPAEPVFTGNADGIVDDELGSGNESENGGADETAGEPVAGTVAADDEKLADAGPVIEPAAETVEHEDAENPDQH